MKVAFCGVRHGHAKGLARIVRNHPDLELAAVAEAEPEACRDIIADAKLDVTHASLEAMLSDADFDILALCGVFSQRGADAELGLRAGKHILSDKPLCTSLDELDRIEALAGEGGLSVFSMLTMRYLGAWSVAREAILGGRIGEVITVSVFGRHGLKYGSGRPAWYFEKGKHGGTITDLFVHGIDGLEWLAGLPVTEVVAARAWNHQLPGVPHFHDAAQAMFRMANDAGAFMDASYTTPAGHKDAWTLRFNGTDGDLLVSGAGPVVLRRNNEPERLLDPGEPKRGDLGQDLVAEITGSDAPRTLSTSDCLRASRVSLLAQQAADAGATRVAVPPPTSMAEPAASGPS